ncbi:MAG TPA: chemotaxis protein CheX [Pseudobdellovibrionaceae bacterium]|nr:chemotaxis protein CheX [Pseudobdellovibrionaceae bacterium]
MSAAQKITNPLFDKRLITAYVDAVLKTVKTMASTDVTAEKPFIENNFTQKGEIAGSLGLIAPPLRGNLLISFEKASIFSIMENMLGEKYTELNKEVQDAVGELTNMIYGSSKTTLNQLGYNFEMAIPTVITGSFLLSHAATATTLIIPFKLANSSIFYIQITIQS